MQTIIIAAILVGVVGIVIGLFLGISGEKFEVEVDEKEIKIREVLPGNNCGGCGFAGCDALAKAIASGDAPVNGCPVGQSAVAEKISQIMGVDAGESKKITAFVKCQGDCDKAKQSYNYVGPKDCSLAKTLPNAGPKTCSYGCLGFGSCVKACEFDAIHVIDGVAVVDKDKCTACGKCMKACPKNLIEMVPYDNNIRVKCNSKDKGKDVRSACATGCIGCMLCTKQCETGAVTVKDSLAHIDYDKCTGCGKCAEKCPTKAIGNIL